jgi:hypothetical protein
VVSVGEIRLAPRGVCVGAPNIGAGSCGMPREGMQSANSSTLLAVPGVDRRVWPPALELHFPVVAVALADVLPVAIAVAVQHLGDMCGCSDPGHLFVNVLAKIGYVEDTTPIVEARISQVFS